MTVSRTGAVERLLKQYSDLRSGDKVLVIGDDHLGVGAHVCQLFSSLECHSRPLDQALDKFLDSGNDCALVIVVLDARQPIERPGVRQVLAQARDQLAARVLLFVTIDELSSEPQNWTLGDSLEMGFTILESVREQDPVIDLYGHDIRTYKNKPTWLDARDWAHPDRWDRERW